MSRHTVTFDGDASKKFVPNTRRGSQSNSTIQNLTTQTITITVTNQDIQNPDATFDVPASGAVVILAGAIGQINEPYDGWLLTPALAATGTVEISEAG